MCGDCWFGLRLPARTRSTGGALGEATNLRAWEGVGEEVGAQGAAAAAAAAAARNMDPESREELRAAFLEELRALRAGAPPEDLHLWRSWFADSAVVRDGDYFLAARVLLASFMNTVWLSYLAGYTRRVHAHRTGGLHQAPASGAGA